MAALETAAVAKGLTLLDIRDPPMTSPRLAPVLILLISAAMVGGALLFQHVGGLTPCELCLFERRPYYAAIALALIALAVKGRGALTLVVVVLCGLLFLGDAGLSFYHVGIEQHWFAGPTACTGPAVRATTIEQLKAQIMHQQPVRCDVVQWSLFGISLAGYNLLASLALAGLCLFSAPHLRRARSS